MDQQRLNHLIDRYLNKTASVEEIKELNDWYLTVNFGDKELDQWISDEYGMDAMTDRMFISFQKNLKELKKSRLKIFLLRWASVAAVTLLFTISVTQLKKHKTLPYAVHEQVSPIKPGNATAILTLGNGKTVALLNLPSGKVVEQTGVVITKKKNGLITYAINSSAISVGKSISYNSIETPNGGEYQVTLPDGTNVWLNAASKLTYPTHFAGKDRIVKLSGEAYFEVAHNPKQPFHVLYHGQDLRVLGTHFNINSYPDEQESKATLLQGSIALTNTVNRESVTLIPGQQAESRMGSEKYMLHSVNVQQVVSWKNGYFQFDNMNIASIMKVLSRWYNLSVKYNHLNMNETYGGTFSRNSNLRDILKNIAEIGDVQFQINDHTIILTGKKGGL